MANQQSIGMNDYPFAKPHAVTNRGSKRGGGADRGRGKFKPGVPAFDPFRRPHPPGPRPPYRGAIMQGPPLRHPFGVQTHQRGMGPGPPPGKQSQPPPFSFSKNMAIPTRPQFTSPPMSSSYPPSSSFPPSSFPPTGPPPSFVPPSRPAPPTGPPPGFPPSRTFPNFNPYFRHPHPSQLFHLSKRGHHHPGAGTRGAKCKKNYRPYHRPRFCKKRGRGSVMGTGGARGHRSKAPSNSALTTSFLMSDYYRQEAVASPDLRGNIGTHPIPDPVSIPICCCEDDKPECDACLTMHFSDHDDNNDQDDLCRYHDDQELESTEEDCDCPDCFDDAAATYDFMKCDFEQVFSELSADEMVKDPDEAFSEADKFS